MTLPIASGCKATRVGDQPKVQQVRRSHLVPLLVVWVIPVVVAAVLLALADLAVLSIALLVTEVVVGAAVYLARKQPETPAAPTPRPWLVPVLMIGSLVAMVGIAVIASKAG
jgi:hypothetical protein